MSQPMVSLNDGAAMPQLGFGVWQVPSQEAASVVSNALDAGYRAVDTAAAYGNEEGVGAAVRASTGRSIFLTTKLWNDDHGLERARRALDASLARLGLETVDLYLIHWPVPRRNRYVETWRTLIGLRQEGKARSIGVSNFSQVHLERIIGETGVVPAINQIELHPRFQQRSLRAFHERHGIATESWSPLGRGSALADPVITAIAAKHRRTPAQVVLRWHLDNGLVVIPKSVTPARIRENLDVFGFGLDADDLTRIQALDHPQGRIGPDPDTASF